MRQRGSGNTNCSSLSYAGALVAELRYDPMGRLYYLRDYTGGTGTKRLVHDGNALTIEYNSNATVIEQRYVHGSNVDADDALVWYPGASVALSNARHLFADPRGSIVLVADDTGGTVAINTYDEYGIPHDGSGFDISTHGRFRYTGQAWLPELGMYYYKARIYSPTLGRFLQTDPIGYEDQFNLYAYVGNDPINAVDPTGLSRIEYGKEARERRELRKAKSTLVSTETISIEGEVGSAEWKQNLQAAAEQAVRNGSIDIMSRTIDSGYTQEFGLVVEVNADKNEVESRIYAGPKVTDLSVPGNVEVDTRTDTDTLKTLFIAHTHTGVVGGSLFGGRAGRRSIQLTSVPDGKEATRAKQLHPYAIYGHFYQESIAGQLTPWRFLEFVR